jgi:hypothetical protein
MVEFTYNYDVVWLEEFSNVMSGNTQRVKNNAFNVSVGIGFDGSVFNQRAIAKAVCSEERSCYGTGRVTVTGI